MNECNDFVKQVFNSLSKNEQVYKDKSCEPPEHIINKENQRYLYAILKENPSLLTCCKCGNTVKKDEIVLTKISQDSKVDDVRYEAGTCWKCLEKLGVETDEYFQWASLVSLTFLTHNPDFHLVGPGEGLKEEYFDFWDLYGDYLLKQLRIGIN